MDAKQSNGHTVPVTGLAYPFEESPERCQGIEVADGVFWLRMNMPSRLNHVNVWMLRDGDGWTVVDTGLNNDETQDMWREVFAEFGGGKPVKRVIGTHLHPDHIGLAGWITRQYDAHLWMTQTDFLMCKTLIMDTGKEPPSDALSFYERAGFPEHILRVYKERFGRFGMGVYTFPASYQRIKDNDKIDIDGREWEVVVGRGHAPEHACLYNKELKVLISGDQVLPRITSNVSVFPMEPESNPLKDWLDSCHALQERLPADLLVLPSHQEPFYGLHNRLQELIDGHEKNLADLKDLISTPKRSIDVFDVLFARKITEEVYLMATGESVAHLNCLIGRGNATRETADDGVYYYSST